MGEIRSDLRVYSVFGPGENTGVTNNPNEKLSVNTTKVYEKLLS